MTDPADDVGFGPRVLRNLEWEDVIVVIGCLFFLPFAGKLAVIILVSLCLLTPLLASSTPFLNSLPLRPAALPAVASSAIPVAALLFSLKPSSWDIEISACLAAAAPFLALNCLVVGRRLWVVAAVVCAVVFWSPLDAVAVGIGAVSFISTFLLATGPLSSSFTFAEAVIAADGVAGLVMVATGAALGMESLPRSNIGIAVLAVLLGIVSMVALSVVSAWSQYRPGAPLPTLTIAHFLAIVGASGFLVVLPFMHFHGVLFWTLEFVFRLDHLVVLGIWGVAVVGTVTVLRGFVESRVPRIVARKLYHALAVAIFLPSAVHRLELLQFSLAVAAFLLIALEIYRAFKVEPLHDLIEGFMASQIDSRDGGNVILTHLYLLFGCAVPVWLAGASPNPLAPLAGVLMIGIGDSMASAVGKWKGKTPWPGTRKTIEGTAAAFLSVAAVQWWLCRGQALGVGLGLGLGLECGQPTWTRTAFELLAVALVCILEAFTSQIDNILLPIVLASSLNFAASG